MSIRHVTELMQFYDYCCISYEWHHVGQVEYSSLISMNFKYELIIHGINVNRTKLLFIIPDSRYFYVYNPFSIINTI